MTFISPAFNEQELYRLYVTEGKTADTIGDELGVSESTVFRWLIRCSIARIPPHRRERADLTHDLLYDLYVVKRLSSIKIGRMLKCSCATVREHLRKHGISIRSHSDAAQRRYGIKNNRYRHGQSRNRRAYRYLVTFSSCIQCGSTSRLVVHHVNHDYQDNSPDNLQVMCTFCHAAYHSQLSPRAHNEKGQFASAKIPPV